jgi:chromosome segregation ATPase
LKEIIEIFTKFSGGVKDWREKWYGKYADQHTKVTAFQSLWEIFGASVLATDDFVERIDDSLEKLNDARRSIPKRDKDQSLKARIAEAGSDVEKLQQEIADLKTKLNRLNSKSPTSASSISNRFNYQTRQEDIQNRQTEKKTIIAEKEKLLVKQKKKFRLKQVELFEEAKDEEIQLCEKLKNQSKAFIEALDINPEGFTELLKECNPAKSFKEWNKGRFGEHTKHSDKSQSNENETSSKKTKDNNKLSNKDANED